jgi:hypothetical protein
MVPKTPSKKALIFIGAGVISLVVVTLFCFLIFNDGKSQASSAQIKKDNKSNILDTISSKKNTDFENAAYKKIYLDGKEYKVPKGDLKIDKQGNLMVDAKFMAQVLGEPISWKNDSVYIGKEPSADNLAQYLDATNYLKTYSNTDSVMLSFKVVNNSWSDKSSFSIGGEKQLRGIGFEINHDPTAQDSEIYADYNLGGKYKKFEAKIGVDDSLKDSKCAYVIRLFDDNDKKIYESSPLQGGDFAKPIDVDVSGVIRLKIEVQRTKEDLENTKGKVILAEARVE